MLIFSARRRRRANHSPNLNRMKKSLYGMGWRPSWSSERQRQQNERRDVCAPTTWSAACNVATESHRCQVLARPAHSAAADDHDDDATITGVRCNRRGQLANSEEASAQVEEGSRNFWTRLEPLWPLCVVNSQPRLQPKQQHQTKLAEPRTRTRKKKTRMRLKSRNT